MENKLLSALESIPVSELSYTEWINVGMALKAEGFDCSLWDSWSRNDSRYKPGECCRKWKGFHGSTSPVRGGTIVQMAKDRGWRFFGDDGVMGWNDEIFEDGDAEAPPKPQGVVPQTQNPAQELITYLQTLFEPTDRVAYVTNDVWQDDDGKWIPAKGAYDRTAAELIEAIRKHPDDLGAALGDWKPGAGAWIRFNPVDGNGVKNENVTRFRYALVESDTMPVEEQLACYQKLELPIACLVHSGGKSLHAIVRVDADTLDEYRKRVDFLYDFLGKNGVAVDTQNRNPSRLSRMPGVTRNGNRQYLVGCNMGRKSWLDWLDFAEGVQDEMPPTVELGVCMENMPPLPEELICGVLRRGHKMLISGPSKAAKSFLLMELCIAIAEGLTWLGFPCKKGRVLYVNLEIDPASCVHRFSKIYEALHLTETHMNDIVIWNLRGHAKALKELVPYLKRRARDQHFDAVVLDPIYKIQDGDENKAGDIAVFCNQLDNICTDIGCSTIYCHHHSKGSQGQKKAMDRASGSGVFARDADAILDIIALELTSDMKYFLRDDNATPWRLECSLREFANPFPVNFWFDYLVHRVDTSGELEKAAAEGSAQANLAKSGKRTSAEERRTSLETAYQACSINLPVKIADIAAYLGVDERTVRNRVKEFSDIYWVEKGIIGLKSTADTE